MYIKQFDEVAERAIGRIRKTLAVKGVEYQRGGNVFSNFIASGRRHSIPKEKALNMYRDKHEVSICDMIDDIESGRWRPTRKSLNSAWEKIGDDINYLIILLAMIEERCQEAAEREGGGDE